MNSDYKIWKKARNKIIFKLILYFLVVCLFMLATSLLLSLDFLKTYETHVRSTFLYVSLGEIFLWLMVYLAISTGKRWTRWLYWLAFAVQASFICLPVSAMGQDMSHALVYLAWIFCMFIQLVIELQMGLSLYRGRSAKIYFDHILEVYDDEPEVEIEHKPAQPVSQPTDRKKSPEPVEEVPAPLTWPQAAFRLGICVYGELIVFPIIVQMFQGWFSSMDMRSVFATRDMFLICIFSAFVWTVPIFFLYYSQKSSKKVLWGSIALEAVFALWYGTRLLEYWNSGQYPSRVFILFIILNIVRYALIGTVIAPVLKGEAVPGQKVEDDLDLKL